MSARRFQVWNESRGAQLQLGAREDSAHEATAAALDDTRERWRVNQGRMGRPVPEPLHVIDTQDDRLVAVVSVRSANGTLAPFVDEHPRQPSERRPRKPRTSPKQPALFGGDT